MNPDLDLWRLIRREVTSIYEFDELNFGGSRDLAQCDRRRSEVSDGEQGATA